MGKTLEILSLLVAAGGRGVSLDDLSLELQINREKLIVILEEHSDFFTRVPNTNRYVVNRFGKYLGDVEKMKEKILSKNLQVNNTFNDDEVYYLVVIFSTFLILQELAKY